MPVIRVEKKKAETTKKQLIQEGLLDHKHLPAADKDYVYFSVKNVPKGMNESKKKLEATKRPLSFRELARKKLTDEELKFLPRAYDTAGTIAIIDVPDELMPKAREIGAALLKSNKRVKTVLRRGVHEGEFRTQKLELLAGEDTREATIAENNVRLKTNLETVYFSVRLGHERKRITELVKPDERVLVMFSGAGPYVCVIAKNTKAKEVVGVEINPDGHRYAEENLKMNKIKTAGVYCGDAKTIVPTLGKFDRILMPLPHSSEEFLDTAIRAANDGATIHFYRFLKEDEFQKAERWCKEACTRNRLKYTKQAFTLCGQSAPGTYRTCLDFRVRN
jgi:tRNA (guanine37-N1)-methyltransferase